MSEINITVQGGTSKRLLTAGKYCDRDIVVAATGGGGSDEGRLPSGYAELPYLRSNEGEYIDTGWAAQAGCTLTIETSIESGNSEAAFGGYDSQFELYYSYTYQGMTPKAWSNFTKITALQIHSGVIPYNQRNTMKIRFDSNQTAGTVLLFAYRPGMYPFVGKIYTAVIEDASGTKIRDFVPCINPSGEYGMYDLANGVFYGNAGNGEFAPETHDKVQQATPTITLDEATGIITAESTQSAGLVSAGTKQATMQLDTQGEQTITPGTSDVTIPAGKYLTGVQTILGDPNCLPENIRKDVTLFGMLGTFAGNASGEGSSMEMGTFTMSENNTTGIYVPHNLGKTPNFAFVMAERDFSTSSTASALVGVLSFYKKMKHSASSSSQVNTLHVLIEGYNSNSQSTSYANRYASGEYFTDENFFVPCNATCMLRSGETYLWVCGAL